MIHHSERQDELCQEMRDLRSLVYTLSERVIELETMVRGLDAGGAAGQYLAACVDRALADPAQKSRTVIVALAAEMTLGISDRSLVSRCVAALAEFDADHSIFGTSDSEVPFKFAAYLAEPVSGTNRWGSAVTRRVHNMLDAQHVQPRTTGAAR